MKKYTIKDLKKISQRIPLDTILEPYTTKYYETGVMFSPKDSVTWFLDNIKTYEKENNP